MVVLFNDKCVIKLPTASQGVSANKREWALWKKIRNTSIQQSVIPSIRGDKSGTFLIAERAEPISKNEYLAHKKLLREEKLLVDANILFDIPTVYFGMECTDIAYQNFGKYNGTIRLLDYADCRIKESV